MIRLSAGIKMKTMSEYPIWETQKNKNPNTPRSDYKPRHPKHDAARRRQ